MHLGGPTPPLEQTLWLLSPELALLLAGLLILGLDTIRPHAEEKRWPPYVTLVGLAGALAATASLWGCNARVFFVLSCDPFALVIKAVTLVAMGLVVLISDVYMRARSRHQAEFYALLLFSALTICLLGGATNLIMIFLAFDFLSIISYLLTGYLRDDRRSSEAAIKYFLYGATLSAVMLYGLSWLYGLTGTTDLSGIAAALKGTPNAPWGRLSSLPTHLTILLPLIFVVAGLAFKMGIVPFHQWAPDAYEGAPTPVTALLSVGPKIAGFALIVRVMLTGLPAAVENLTLDWQTLLMALAALTMTVGNLVALWQHNVKRLLAYSSISQAGYVLIGVVTASPRGLAAALFYLAAYVLTNLGAFAAVVAFSNQTGSDMIEDYGGLNERSPALTWVLIVCLLSLVGLPPTAGFIGKLNLFAAALEKGLLWLAVVGVLNSIVSLSYYWKIIRTMYMARPQIEARLAVSPMLAVAMGVTVAGVLAIGIFPGPLLALVEAAVRTFSF